MPRMDPELTNAITSIHSSSLKVTIFVTGGGAQVLCPYRLEEEPSTVDSHLSTKLQAQRLTTIVPLFPFQLLMLRIYNQHEPQC